MMMMMMMMMIDFKLGTDVSFKAENDSLGVGRPSCNSSQLPYCIATMITTVTMVTVFATREYGMTH